MSKGNEIRSPALILANAAWLRSFTRKLVQDADLAKDLHQEVLLAGLSGGGSASGPVRAWLAGVARNMAVSLARKESRRQRAEKVAAREGSVPDTSDLAAEAELQRAAVGALLALPDPYRSTLLMRFMKGVSSREIARLSSVPVETVRTRIKRGLSMLRSSLDREHGGSRGWLAAVTPPWKPGTSALWGIVLMKLKTKVLLAAGVVAVSLLGIWYFAGPPPSGPEAPELDAAGTLTGDRAEPAAVALAGDRTALPPEAPAPARIEAGLLVRVTWEDTGLPAEGVGLAVMEPAPASALPRLVPTGETGTALFEGLEPGTYIVDSNMEIGGFVELTAGRREIMELTVAAGVPVRGVVVDRDGVPVAGAEILCVRSEATPQWPHHLADSAGDGSFSLSSLRRQNLVGARAEGHGTSDFASLQDLAADSSGDVVLRLVLPGSPATMTGTVFNPGGHPVAGAWVRIGRAHGQPLVHLLTDDRGMFRCTSLRPGPLPLHVYARGYSRWKGTVDCLAGAPTHVNVQLQTGASLSGRVLDREGEPVEGAFVSVPAGYPAEVGVTQTDAEGRYRFDDLPGGELRVSIHSEDLGSVQPTVLLTEGLEHHVDFTLDPDVGLQIRGRLVDHLGQPLEGWIVEAKENERASRADGRGMFALNNMESSLYTLRVFRPRMVGPHVLTLDPVFPGSGELTIEVPEDALPSARILGRVLMPDGTSAAGVRFRFKDHMNPMVPVPESDEEGRFEIGPLPPGTYTPLGSLPGYLDADFGEVVLAPDEVRPLPDARVGYGADLSLTMTAAGPEQMEGLEVLVLDEEGRSIRRGARHGTSVDFRLLPPGSYQLSIKGPNATPQLLPIELKARETLALEIDLR